MTTDDQTGIDRITYRQTSLGDIGGAWTCKTCGTLVTDTTLHNAWHQGKTTHDPLCYDKTGHPHDNECECWCHDN